MRNFGFYTVALGVIIMAICTQGSSAPEVEYITDIQDRISFATQGWGELGIDTCAHLHGTEGLPLRIKDKVYTKGIGHHAPGEIIIELDGLYDFFEAEVGVQWQNGNVGSVVFQVYVDDEEKFDSGIMREQDPPKSLRISVEGAQELRLVATDAGDGITCDCANWAEARLTKSAISRPRKEEQMLFDVAPFARIVSWDPNRTDGARASRIQEFREEDLFLESDVEPTADGIYEVPNGCIGLQWFEKRRLVKLGVVFAEGSPYEGSDEIRVEGWVGESLWQGNWKPLAGTLSFDGRELFFSFDSKANPEARQGYRKIRWIFPASTTPVRLRKLTALSRIRTEIAECTVYLEKPIHGRHGTAEIYNGCILSPEGNSYRCEWDLSSQLRLKIRHTKSKHNLADRTVIRFSSLVDKEGNDVAFGIAVDDLLANGCIYVPQAGLFATTDFKANIADYKKKIARRKTILERVRKMPDQSFEQAMAKTHNPIQDNGPTMLSLACDNRKFLVQQDGVILFNRSTDFVPQAVVHPSEYKCMIQPQFGSGKCGRPKRHLEGGWLPVLVSFFSEGGITYHQRTFVAPFGEQITPGLPWLNDKPLFVAEFRIENMQSKAADAALKLDFLADVKKGQGA
ncbi:MAG: NPCBM/NEW2 domain-containing protein, partial [Armatimonadota bacterium]|nr:NPCBM/NEW2 domain-containing protein [Armatimonadota bacterium]